MSHAAAAQMTINERKKPPGVSCMGKRKEQGQEMSYAVNATLRDTRYSDEIKDEEFED